MSEVDYGKGRDLSVIWEFRKISHHALVIPTKVGTQYFWLP